MKSCIFEQNYYIFKTPFHILGPRILKFLVSKLDLLNRADFTRLLNNFKRKHFFYEDRAELLDYFIDFEMELLYEKRTSSFFPTFHVWSTGYSSNSAFVLFREQQSVSKTYQDIVNSCIPQIHLVLVLCTEMIFSARVLGREDNDVLSPTVALLLYNFVTVSKVNCTLKEKLANEIYCSKNFVKWLKTLLKNLTFTP